MLKGPTGPRGITGGCLLQREVQVRVSSAVAHLWLWRYEVRPPEAVQRTNTSAASNTHIHDSEIPTDNLTEQRTILVNAISCKRKERNGDREKFV